MIANLYLMINMKTKAATAGDKPYNDVLNTASCQKLNTVDMHSYVMRALFF